MTWHLLDVAIYQGSLKIEDVIRAEFDAVNLKVSHGLGQKSVHPDVAGWATRAKAVGLNVCTFHFLDSSASGAAQAEYAYGRLQALGLTGVGHTVDVEAPGLTAAIIGDYVRTMTTLLLRKIFIYSGAWRWEAGWLGVELSPYLWSAPRAGYLGGYPGDDSPHWRAGYGGWTDLSVLQYSVGPLTYPDGSTGSIKVSKSAIRDPQVWVALTGGEGMAWIVVASLEALRAEFNRVFPNRDKTSDGGIGDQAHATSASGHNPDETGRPEDYDADSIDEIRARDFDADLRHPTVSMEKVTQYLLGECRAGRITWIKYLIFNRRIWRAANGWKQETYTGPSPHTEHLHVSCKPDTASETNTRPVGLATLLEDGMPLSNDDVDRVARKTRDLILYETRFPWSSEDYQGNGYQRNVEDFYKDMWTALYRSGNGGGPGLPEQSPFTTIITLLRAVAARDVDADKIADAVVAKLPADRDDITVPELAEAIRQAVHNPTGQA